MFSEEFLYARIFSYMHSYLFPFENGIHCSTSKASELISKRAQKFSEYRSEETLKPTGFVSQKKKKIGSRELFSGRFGDCFLKGTLNC